MLIFISSFHSLYNFSAFLLPHSFHILLTLPHFDLSLFLLPFPSPSSYLSLLCREPMSSSESWKALEWCQNCAPSSPPPRTLRYRLLPHHRFPSHPTKLPQIHKRGSFQWRGYIPPKNYQGNINFWRNILPMQLYWHFAMSVANMSGCDNFVITIFLIFPHHPT